MAHLPRYIGCVECKVPAGPQVLAAILACGLDDLALVVRRINL